MVTRGSPKPLLRVRILLPLLEPISDDRLFLCVEWTNGALSDIMIPVILKKGVAAMELEEENKQPDWYRSRYEALRMENQALRLRVESVEQDYLNSASWKLTAPVRKLSGKLHPRACVTPQDAKPLQAVAGQRDPELQRLIDAHGEVPVYPPVTVAVPVAGDCTGLGEALASLEGQTWQSTEVLCVCAADAGDDDRKLAREWAERTGNRCLETAEAGEAAALNVAIAEAQGDFFAFQCASAPSMPDRLALAVAILQRQGADLVCSPAENQSEDGKIHLETVTCRIGALRRVGGFKAALGADAFEELWLRLAGCGFALHAMKQPAVKGKITHEGTGRDLTREAELMPVHRPKVAYVIPGCTISGGVTVACHHVNRLLKRGWEVLLLSESGEREIPWFPDQRVPVLPFEDAPDDIDVMVATSYSTAYSVLQYPQGQKCYFVQDDEIRFFPAGSHQAYLAKQSYRFPLTFFTITHWLEDWLRETFGQESVYVPNGMDERLMHLCPGYREEGRKPRILLEGAISSPRKGMEEAFRAVEGLDCEVWCISASGRPKPEWHCDRFFEKVSAQDMKYIYSSCDILLKMSHEEGFGYPPLEMMLCGGVCVANRTRGFDEYMVNGENALVVEQGDVQGAHDALQRLLDDPALREKLRQGGQKTAREWTWDRSIDTLEELFTRLWKEDTSRKI